MKVSKFLPMVLFLGVLSFSSCNDDDDDDDEPAPTRSELLTAKNWMVSALTVDPELDWNQDGTQESNIIPFIPACTLDDFFNFNANGTFTNEEGASKCDPNDPTIVNSGDWLWNSDQTRLILESNDGSTTESKIISISSSEIVLESQVVLQDVTYTFTETWN